MISNTFLTIIFISIYVASSIDEPACYGYIIDNDAYIPGKGPLPIPCQGDSTNGFGDSWGPNEYQSNSCCSGTGRYFVATGQIGGFDASYGSPDNFPICSAHVDALQSLLCDPQQGKYIRTDNPTSRPLLRVCRSSCDAVFEHCGLPGEVFPDFTNYFGGTSLCYDMWGGFDYSNDDTYGCGRPDGFPCQIDLGIQVVEEDCLEMILPSNSVIEHFKQYNSPPTPPVCNIEEKSLSAGMIAVIVVAVIGGLGCAIFVIFVIFYLRRGRHPPAPVPKIPADTHQLVEKPLEMNVTNVHVLPVAHPVTSVDDEFEIVASCPPMDNNPAANEKYVTKKKETTIKNVSSNMNVPPAVANGIVDFVDKSLSADKKTVVRDWITANPSAAALLTPKEVALVISKVSFSLDHPDLARILAEGIQGNGGSVTTAHIIKAMEQSPFQDADIAKQVAPLVTDPENKHLVLQALQMEFSKDDVSNRFPSK